MKMIITLLLVSCLTNAALGQLEIKSGPNVKRLAEVKSGGSVIADLSTSVLSTGDTVYMFGYLNSRYKTLYEWENFSITGLNDTKQFLDLVKSMYERKKKDEEYTIKVNRKVELSVSWIGNDIFVIVTDRNGIYSTYKLTQKILEKLSVL